MQSQKLAGAWKIVSFELQRSSGEVIYPCGRDPLGMMMYDSRGNMSVLLMRRDDLSLPQMTRLEEPQKR